MNIKENIMFVIAYNDLFVYKHLGDFSFLNESEKDSMAFYLAVKYVDDYDMIKKAIR